MSLLRAAWAGVMAATLVTAPAAAEPPTLALPVIDVTSVDGGLMIEGRVLGLASGTVEASMALMRADSSGRTATRQSRSIEVSAGSRDVVASTQLSAGEGAQLDVTLTLRSQGRVFARSEIHLAPDLEVPDSRD